MSAAIADAAACSFKCKDNVTLVLVDLKRSPLSEMHQSQLNLFQWSPSPSENPKLKAQLSLASLSTAATYSSRE